MWWIHEMHQWPQPKAEKQVDKLRILLCTRITWGALGKDQMGPRFEFKKKKQKTPAYDLDWKSLIHGLLLSKELYSKRKVWGHFFVILVGCMAWGILVPWLRDGTCVPCSGVWSPNHWTSRKFLVSLILLSFLNTLPVSHLGIRWNLNSLKKPVIWCVLSLQVNVCFTICLPINSCWELRSEKACGCWSSFFLVDSAFDAPLSGVDEIFICWGQGRIEAVGNDLG